MRLTLGFSIIAAALAAAPPAGAALTISGSSGSRNASVTFDVVGTQLIVTLSNTATSDVMEPSDVLTAVFFDVAGNPLLTRGSGVLNPGNPPTVPASTVFYDTQPAGGVIGGEWAYKNGLNQSGLNSGISSSGLSDGINNLPGLFGPGDRFPGDDLATPVSPDGLQYGLLSAGDDTSTGNGGITGSGGLIKNSVVFALGVPDGFDLSSIGHKVRFQYGTDINEPSFVVVPEPSTYIAGALLAIPGILGLSGVARRRGTTASK